MTKRGRDGGALVGIRDLLAPALDGVGGGAVWLEVRIRQAWPRAVGDEVAARASVLRLRRGCLELGVVDDAWVTELRYLSDEIRNKLNAVLGENVVHEVACRRVRQRP